MATKEEKWQAYLQEYNTNLQIAKQHVDSVVNSGTATQAEKEKARSDYAKQLAYYNILQNVYNEAVESGTFPDTFDIDSSNKGSYSGIYTIAGDSSIYMSNIMPCGYEGVCAVSEHFNVFWKVYRETGGEIIDLPDLYPDYVTVYPGYGQDTQGFFAGWVFDSTLVFDAWVMTKDNSGFFTTTWNYQTGIVTGTSISQFAAHIYSNNTIPNFTQGQNIDRGSMFGGSGLAIVLPEEEISTDDPWDYYNDDILPGLDQDNAAFPDGYEPEPDTSDPDDDIPIDTPVITGDNMEIQDDRTLGTPSDFITMYMITPPILSQFGKTLWTSLANYNPLDPTTVDILKNFYAVLNEQVTGSLDISSIISFIVSVRQYPFAVSDITNIYELVGNSISFGTGKLPINCGSAAQVYRLTSTIGVLDLGTVTIADYNGFKLYNDFRDYYNTSVSAYLPYCGTVELNPIEAIHSTIHCYYAIDFYTGECTAFLTTTTEDGHTIISGTKSGTIGVLIPITATNSGQVAARHLSDNAKDSMLIASAAGNMFGAVGNLATGNVFGAAANITGLAQIGAKQSMLDAERRGRSAVMAPSLSGGVGAAAFVSPATASILVRRGTYARHKIANYPQTCGYPATSSGQLKTYRGYTECYNVNVDSINCTEEEKAAIKSALETGVYLPTDL